MQGRSQKTLLKKVRIASLLTKQFTFFALVFPLLLFIFLKEFLRIVTEWSRKTMRSKRIKWRRRINVALKSENALILLLCRLIAVIA